MIKQKIYNSAENKMQLTKPNGYIIEEIDKEANIQENKNLYFYANSEENEKTA